MRSYIGKSRVNKKVTEKALENPPWTISMVFYTLTWTSAILNHFRSTLNLLNAQFKSVFAKLKKSITPSIWGKNILQLAN